MAIYRWQLSQLHFGKISEKSQWKKSELFEKLERKFEMIWKIEEMKFSLNPKSQQKLWTPFLIKIPVLFVKFIVIGLH